MIVTHHTKHDLNTTQKSHPLYKKLVDKDMIIEGVYDDHDIGVNDADNRLSRTVQKEAQQLLLDFLDIDNNDIRRQRDGVYSVHKLDDIMIIILDTRTNRSPTIIPSIGKWEFPNMAFLASYIRYLTAYFGFVHDYNGSVLDKEQWHWFQQILQSKEYKESNLVLIISSTQIFTSNPYFESWGHFPSEKKKLLEMLKNVSVDDKQDNEQHVLFISGDVHHAELIYGNEEYGPLEVTSSGLTHSLKTIPGLFGLQAWIATHITDTYQDYHRTKYRDQNIPNGYYGLNFGMIEILDNKKYNLKIIDARSGVTHINVPLNNNGKSSLREVLDTINNEDHIYFPIKYPFLGLEIIGPPLALIGVIMIILYGLRNRNSLKTKRDKEL